MTETTPVNTNALNPLYSQIENLFLIRDDGVSSNEELNLLDRNLNTYCQFEKIEMIESIFEPYPKGSLVVRDISDIITYIQEQKFNTIYVKYLNGTKHYFYITSVSYLNNAASETEETYVSINFTNHLYHVAEQESLINIMDTPKPVVSRISDYFILMTTNLKEFVTKHFWYGAIPTIKSDKTNNFVLYKPLNTLESRTEVPTDNFMQYLSYLSAYSVPKQTPPDNGTYDSVAPRFMFWTGWDNTLNLKYFYQNCDSDTVENQYLNQNTLRYAVYDSDVRSISMRQGNNRKVFKKIYSFSTNPANQFMSTKYFYVRKTPKLLNEGTSRPYDQLLYQYQDEGEKYDIQIVSSEGIISSVKPGANELIYEGDWGYFDSFTSTNLVNKPTHIGNVFGTDDKYMTTDFMGDEGYFPYVDNSEMWKHQFDLTPIHPNAPLLSYEPNNNNLTKLISLRYDIFQSTNGVSKQLKKIREVERQNFVAYVLCCLTTEEENLQDETFFAAITGYTPESEVYAQAGVNGEPLKYLYYFVKLKSKYPNFSSIPPSNSENNPFRAFETSQWEFDLQSNDKSVPGDFSTYAVNLNERTNFFTSSEYGVSGRYNPGWHALSILTSEYLNVTYRPIGHDIKDLDTVAGGPNFDFGKFHIVKMTKTPIKRLLLEAGATDETLLNYYANRYLYTFAAENIVDGRCPTPNT